MYTTWSGHRKNSQYQWEEIQDGASYLEHLPQSIEFTKLQALSTWDPRDEPSEKTRKDSTPAVGIHVPNVASTARKDLNHLTCFNSDKKGHYAIKCPKPRKDRDISEDQNTSED